MSVISDEEHEQIKADHAAGRHSDLVGWSGEEAGHPACPECNADAFARSSERSARLRGVDLAVAQMRAALKVCLSTLGEMSESTLSRDRAFFVAEARREEVTAQVTKAIADYDAAVKAVPK